MSKKAQTPTTIEETTEQEIEVLTAKDQYFRAEDEIKRLKHAIQDKQHAIEDHVLQISIIQQKLAEAKAAHDEALKDERDNQERIEYQQMLARIGGLGEQETLQALQPDQERLAKNIDFTRQNLAEVEKLLGEIPAIVEDLEKIKSERDQLERERGLMDSIQSDMLHCWGKEEQSAFIAELEAAQEDFATKEKARNEARNTLQEKQQSVRDRLRYWPGLAEHVEEKYLQIIREDPRAMPEEMCFNAQIAYIKVLGKWGPQCMNMLHHRSIAELLALPPQIVAALMHPKSGMWKDELENGEWVKNCQLITTAKSFIEAAREARSN